MEKTFLSFGEKITLILEDNVKIRGLYEGEYSPEKFWVNCYLGRELIKAPFEWRDVKGIVREKGLLQTK